MDESTRPTTAGLRIGDAERDAAVSRLGEHLREGRLRVAEYDERAQRAWDARTAADLGPLFADLPGGAPSLPGRIAPRRHQLRPQPAARRLLLVLLVIMVITGWVAVTHVPPFFVLILLWFGLGRRRWHRQHSGPAWR